MTFRYIPGKHSNNMGLVLFRPEQYPVVESILESMSTYEYTLTNSTIWLNIQSEAHFAAFTKLFMIKLNQANNILVGGA